MTYSIVARDPRTGEMGVATASFALAVGSSVPWAEPAYGVIATQSMGEPMYGDLGLDALRGGLTAQEALTALRAVDPHPERRQVAMVDECGRIAAYTGDACVADAGHELREECCALANMVASTQVWPAMADTFERSTGTLAERLVASLEAAEGAGGDLRGQRSAAVLVVRATRTGRPWRDQVVDLRVDDHPRAVDELRRLLEESARYHRMVTAFERTMAGDVAGALALVEAMPPQDPASHPDLVLWEAVVLLRAGEQARAREVMRELDRVAPRFVETARRFGPAGLLGDPGALEELLAG